MRDAQIESGTTVPPPGAIVLGGNFVGLAVARALGAHEIPVWVFDSDRSKSIAQFSRFVKRFIVAPINATPERLLEEAHAHELRNWVVFPVSDEYVEAVSANHSSLLEVFRLITPPMEVTRFALDKRLTYSRAAELGIAAPWTLVCADTAQLAERDIPFPVILKPAVNHHFFPHTNVKALAASDRSELMRRHAQMSEYIPGSEILIQEMIPGGGENQFSFCAACREGVPYATLVALRRRQYPVDFGNASSFVETTTQAIVEEHGRRFLESIGFDGMAEVEFKYDSRDGLYKILDCNPRPWGWHALGVAAGIDFAYLTFLQKTGRPIPRPPTLRPAAWLREITDPLSILKSGRAIAEIKRLARALVSRKITLATLSLGDPVPFFAEFFLWASQGRSRQQKAKELRADS